MHTFFRVFPIPAMSDAARSYSMLHPEQSVSPKTTLTLDFQQRCHAGEASPDQARTLLRATSASPRWPCQSKVMANVTALHGGGNKATAGCTARSKPCAGFAVESSPVSLGEHNAPCARCSGLWFFSHALMQTLNIKCFLNQVQVPARFVQRQIS